MLTVIAGPHLALAQEKKKAAKPRKPLAMVNFAGVERLLTDLDYALETAGRPELSDSIGPLLKQIGDLKGLDRKKPLGAMIFLMPGLPPRPEAVGFVPVESIDDLIKTVSLAPVDVKKVDGKENRYEILRRRGRNQTPVQVRLHNGYAFLCNDADLIDESFTEAMTAAKKMTTKYDVSAQIDLGTVPQAIRGLFLTTLRISAQGELQRRDNESPAAARIRRANGNSMLELLEMILTDGEKITIGMDASKENKRAVIDLAVDVTKDSKFAKYLTDIGGKTSHFASLIDEDSALAISVSWNMDKRERNSLTEVLKAARGELATRLGTEEQPSKIADGLMDAFDATATAGHVDGFVRFAGEKPGDFVLVGGLKLATAKSAASSLSQILQRIEENPELELVERNVATHRGVALHRLLGKNIRKQDERIYGGKPSLYVGIGSKVIWFTVGGNNAIDTLKKTIDQLAENAGKKQKPGASAPFRFTMHMGRWVGVSGEDNGGNGDDARPRPGRDFARQAFAKGDDLLRVDIRPTETGGRFRIEMEEGFIRMLGMGLSRRLERGFDGPQERPKRPNRPKKKKQGK
jgi:hypothetical protein